MSRVKKKIYAIINPVSGTKSKKEVPDMLASIDAHKYDVHLLITGYEGHATQIALDAVKENVDCVIAVGGDGTVNEVAKVLIDTNVVLGIIPSGSGNGLARDLNIPLNLKKAVEIIKEGVVSQIDYGVANGHIFFCTCGVGFDALVSEKALNQSSRGKLMYAKSMLDVYVNFKPERYKITTPDGNFDDKSFLVTCANASQYGYNGFIAPDANMQDGKMNIAILKSVLPMNIPQTALQLVSKNIGNNSNLVEIITSEALIERESDGVMHLDGNAIQTDKNISVKIVKQGLKVLVPREIEKPAFDAQSFLTNITRWI
ncbi:diacylglycerol/lipid kinase family protein [Dysgonomonas macrotermitis]|uniref:Lipid kinase, YegS/Rv2252/BmrU family n=1 Tax=Dysgonomonas macrotermitis TaxID=1346286 RepID=A0A1M5F7W9_9BACT|nr:diacylglycerol kinase family protein [Dysgonomonas macrotermitis]SHF87488.1 lipid kinase, YegS/Rv2252/BmrU family [Dysgonomonas macrotermitis]